MERPILFSGEMVRAILEGRKTQTRRIMTPQPERSHGGLWVWKRTAWDDAGALVSDQAPVDLSPYGQAGDTLWVREAIGRLFEPEGEERWCDSVYLADMTPTPADCWPWKNATLPSMHMPRGLSRISLLVKSVRVERLQDITPEAVVREGVTVSRCDCERCAQTSAMCPATATDHITAFALLWNGINGKRAPWSSNPWVWAIGFEVLP